jgi:molybdopterin-guanine dinucleotide biosynthesis protein A
LTRKAKQFEVWQDDIEGERGPLGGVSRYLLAFNVAILLVASDI